MHPGSTLQVSELELLHPGRDYKFGLALPAHVLWLHKQLLLPTAGGLGLCASVPLCYLFNCGKRIFIGHCRASCTMLL